jgi:hypothetical protein
MAQLALEIQNSAPRDRGHATRIPSAFTVALDTVGVPQIRCEDNTDAYLNYITSGSARPNVPGNCRVSEEATRIAYTLRRFEVGFLTL